jgi:uncharacterized protein (DUF1015 family)
MPGVTGESTRSVVSGVRTVHSTHHTTGHTTGLELAPFRAVRYNPRRIRDLAAVTAPPYDMIDAATQAQLETADPHNIVRLILPSGVTTGHSERYARAAQTLRAWQQSDVLLTDPSAALYVYEQAPSDRMAGTLQRGLVGALALRTPEEGVILPHEDVSAAVVADRLELIRATAANLEPILLQYDGGGSVSDVVDDVAGTPPLIEAHASDGTRYRVWRLDAPPLVAKVQGGLQDRHALIADGHHRYAAYLQLQAYHRAAGSGPGPWDYGLALLVDAVRYPLEVRAIHRVLPGLPAADLVARANRLAEVIEVPAEDTSSSLARLTASEEPAFLVAGAGRQWLICKINPTLVDSLVPHNRPEAWRRLDTTVLHHVVLEHVWGLPADAVTYHHDVREALRHAERSRGTAVLLRPVPVGTVLGLARQGVRMPRKSTSFGPKPRSGLVLRLFAN